MCPRHERVIKRWIEPLEARIAPAFAAQFSLAALNGHNGFHISGIAAHDYIISAFFPFLRFSVSWLPGFQIPILS